MRADYPLLLAAGSVAAGAQASCADAAGLLAAGRWETWSAGKGSKGERWYRRAWLGTASPRHWLLIRRHITAGEIR